MNIVTSTVPNKDDVTNTRCRTALNSIFCGFSPLKALMPKYIPPIIEDNNVVILKGRYLIRISSPIGLTPLETVPTTEIAAISNNEE